MKKKLLAETVLDREIEEVERLLRAGYTQGKMDARKQKRPTRRYRVSLDLPGCGGRI
ncbi:hypothetical protein [Paraburkholderia sp. J12]|uniref:hypothetical protein n=1 Tax=Paraburkholderia sp. J12 TaxID=2805432 RepID=UPI002ABDBEC8|nr:hypothetical protein [Paraburkholderia sp. J12]